MIDYDVSLRIIYMFIIYTVYTQRCTPQHAVVFVCYEEVKKAMARQTEMTEREEELIRIKIPGLLSEQQQQTENIAQSTPKNYNEHIMDIYMHDGFN